jgi:hypothetical protein
MIHLNVNIFSAQQMLEELTRATQGAGFGIPH